MWGHDTETIWDTIRNFENDWREDFENENKELLSNGEEPISESDFLESARKQLYKCLSLAEELHEEKLDDLRQEGNEIIDILIENLTTE